jgi:hypothetical protein
MKIIPFNPSLSSRQSLSVNIGEAVINFYFEWNIRDSSWYVDLSNTETEILSVKILPNSNLLPINNKLINGNFRVLNVKNSEYEIITYDNFGSVFQLMYGTNEEWSKIDCSLESYSGAVYWHIQRRK